MGILDVYEKMNAVNADEEAVKIAELEETAIEDERMEILAKYAEAADGYLTKEFGTNYEDDDVIKLAGMMLDNDLEQEEMIEKVAELEESGIIMARSHWNELQRLAAEEDGE